MAVAPGFVATALVANIASKVDQIASDIIPMRRVAEPQEVADLVVFLCSERSNYVNGALGACLLFCPLLSRKVSITQMLI